MAGKDDSIRSITIKVTREQRKRIRVAAASCDEAMAVFTRRVTLEAADKELKSLQHAIKRANSENGIERS